MIKLFLKLTFLISLTSVFFISCNKGGVTGEYLLTDEMKDQNPFNGGERLYFRSDSGELFILSGTENRLNQTHEVPEGNDTRYYYLLETDLMRFSSENQVYFWMEMYGHLPPPPRYRIDFEYSDKGREFEFILPLDINTTPFVDSIYIMNRWYYNVFIDEKEKIDNKAFKLYYSTQFGILKIDFSDGSAWELENIEW